MFKAYKLEGRRFGKLKAIRVNKPISVTRRRTHYDCLCKCGNSCIIRVDSLLNNSSKSCGCAKTLVGNKSLSWRGYGEISSSFWNNVKRHARCRNLSVGLEIKDLWELFLKQKKKCKISGIKLTFSNNVRAYDGSASLDRVDSKKHYVKGNVQWVHKKLNMMKGSLTEKEFLNWIEIVYNYQTR